MIVYHGTTHRRAQKIYTSGFLPKRPSRRVWFSEGPGYARRRAKTQARRSHDRPVVLACEIDPRELRRRFGPRKVLRRGGVIAIDAPLPVTILLSPPGLVSHPSSPTELARWVNRLLGLKPRKGAAARDPGVQQLSRLVAQRMWSRPSSAIRNPELVDMALRCLPELFKGVRVDLDRMIAYRTVAQVDVAAIQIEPGVEIEPTLQASARETEALDCLVDPRPKQRVRGLELLAELQEPDLFDWCVMFLGDDSPSVCVAALKTMLACTEADPEVIAPFAESKDKSVRAAAIAALARHSAQDAARWIRQGLADPFPNVRLEAAAFLTHLDPAEHRAIFELALYDPNPRIRQSAEKLTRGQGYGKLSW